MAAAYQLNFLIGAKAGSHLVQLQDATIAGRKAIGQGIVEIVAVTAGVVM